MLSRTGDVGRFGRERVAPRRRLRRRTSRKKPARRRVRRRARRRRRRAGARRRGARASGRATNVATRPRHEIAPRGRRYRHVLVAAQASSCPRPWVSYVPASTAARPSSRREAPKISPPGEGPISSFTVPPGPAGYLPTERALANPSESASPVAAYRGRTVSREPARALGIADAARDDDRSEHRRERERGQRPRVVALLDGHEVEQAGIDRVERRARRAPSADADVRAERAQPARERCDRARRGIVGGRDLDPDCRIASPAPKPSATRVDRGVVVRREREVNAQVEARGAPACGTRSRPRRSSSAPAPRAPRGRARRPDTSSGCTAASSHCACQRGVALHRARRSGARVEERLVAHVDERRRDRRRTGARAAASAAAACARPIRGTSTAASRRRMRRPSLPRSPSRRARRAAGRPAGRSRRPRWPMRRGTRRPRRAAAAAPPDTPPPRRRSSDTSTRNASSPRWPM